MLSKFARVGRTLRCALLVPRLVNRPVIRKILGDIFPRDQYHTPFPERLKLGNMLTVHWEVWPLVISIALALLLVVFILVWNSKMKVDLVFTTNNRNTVSRTMDLRHPTILKLYTINQKCEPWPEMADVLDKMKEAEQRVMMRAQLCSPAN